MRKVILLLFLLSALSSQARQSITDSLLSIANNGKQDSSTIMALVRLSELSGRKGDYPEAKKYLKQALPISEKINFKPGLASIYNNLGLVYSKEGNYPEALVCHFKSLKIKEVLGDKKAISGSYNNMGNIYLYQNDYKQALHYYRLSLHLRQQLHDSIGLAGSYGNVGLIYYKQKDYPNALVNHLASLKLYKSLNIKKGIANSYANIAMIYFAQERDIDALRYFNDSYQIRKVIGDKDGMISNGVNMASLYLHQKKFAQAQTEVYSALEISKDISSWDGLKDCYYLISRIDSANGDFKNAAINYKLFIVYRDSLTNDDNTKKQTQTEMLYEFGKKQTSDSIKNAELVKQETLKHEQEIAQQRMYTIGGSIGFLLMLVVALVSFRAFKQKQKDNILIEHQKSLVEEKQKEVLDSIHYAKRIQKSLLPTNKYIEQNITRLKKG